MVRELSDMEMEQVSGGIRIIRAIRDGMIYDAAKNALGYMINNAGGSPDSSKMGFYQDELDANCHNQCPW